MNLLRIDLVHELNLDPVHARRTVRISARDGDLELCSGVIRARRRRVTESTNLRGIIRYVQPVRRVEVLAPIVGNLVREDSRRNLVLELLE